MIHNKSKDIVQILRILKSDLYTGNKTAVTAKRRTCKFLTLLREIHDLSILTDDLNLTAAFCQFLKKASGITDIIYFHRAPPLQETFQLTTITYYLLLITYYILLSTYYLVLFITYYSFLITYYVLLTTYYLLLITYYLFLITNSHFL